MTPIGMNKYLFNGKIGLNKPINFSVEDGVAYFGMRAKQILPFEEHNVVLKGFTDEGRSIYLLIDHFYQCDLEIIVHEDEEKVRTPHVEGIVEACIVLDSQDIDAISSIGFFSQATPAITGTEVHAGLNDTNALWMGIKEPLGSYSLKGHEYRLSIGFVSNEPFYHGQLLELKADCNFSIEMMKDSYWLIKRLLAFLFQKRNAPLEAIYLRNNEKNIGQLYVEHFDESRFVFHHTKCLTLSLLGDKVGPLLQLLADDKIYLRHIPMNKEEENSYTYGQLLMALVGLENTLDYLNIHVIHCEEHENAYAEVKNELEKLKEKSSGEKKEVYRRVLSIMKKDENLEGRLLVSLNEDKESISNFFSIDALGSPKDIAKDLADLRNGLSHGKLDLEFDIKTNYQMRFLMLYILYMQIKMLGFDKERASQIVPQILFNH